LSRENRLKFEWTIPNALTIFRIVLIPPILITIYLDNWVSLMIGMILYGISAITDALDGKIARMLNQQSEFGAFLDPLADKFLVIGCYAVFALKPELRIPFWLVLLIILRDIWITWLRSVCLKKNIKFTTSLLAKAKTLVQMIGAALIIIVMFLFRLGAHIVNITSLEYKTIAGDIMGEGFVWMVYFPIVLTTLIVLFTLYTGIDYYIQIRRTERGEENG
jgi:CDP-diacylglycerol--glycerol-3-phosphate 3-phosphatidyltransferase